MIEENYCKSLLKLYCKFPKEDHFSGFQPLWDNLKGLVRGAHNLHETVARNLNDLSNNLKIYMGILRTKFKKKIITVLILTSQ